jgi:Ca-activated chloride channel family protein
VILAGLGFAQLAAIFAAVGAAVVGLYILRLRRRTVAIPFSPLWQRILKDKEATSLFSRLKRLLSLLLQLALLALLVLALGDPRAAATLVKGRTLVVLIDASASMQATDVAPNRLGAAKNELKAMIRGLGGADRMLIAQMDAMVTPLGPLSGDTSELERALDQVKATDTRADFPRALRFATDTLRNVENGEIVVVSDGNLGPALDAAGPVHLGDDKLSFVSVGKGKRNVGITQFSVRRYPLDKSRYEVMLEVTNTGPEQEDIELKLLGDGTLVDLTKLRLKPGERLPRFYPNLSGANRTLEAGITNMDGSHDELPADDRAYALLPERRRAKVLVVSTGNTYLEAALLLDEYLDVTQVSPQDYVAKYNNGAGFDSIIFDGATPASPPRAHALYLDPRGPGSPVKVEGELSQPGFDKIERKHPVVRFTALDDVNIARGHKLVPAVGDKAIGITEPNSPILVAGTRAGYKFVAMGFDVRDSDLPLRVAWPLLLLNSINYFTDEDAHYISSFRTGDVWRVPVGTEATQATLTLPGGGTAKVPVHEGRAVYLGDRAGFYELAAGDTAQPEKAPGAQGKTSFAANLLDAQESTITPAAELLVDGKPAGKVEGFHVGVRREIWIYLLLGVLLLTAIEWATYHRRVTV